MRSPIKSPTVVALSSNTSTALKILADVGETLINMPYISAIAALTLQILEIRAEITSNKELCYRLIDNVAARTTALVQALEQLKDAKLKDLEKDLKRYKNLLLDIHRGLGGLTATGLARAVIGRDDIKKKLHDYSNRLAEFDNIFVFTRLVSIVDRIDSHVSTPAVASRPTITNLAPPPPPSNFFTGREEVLTRMDHYFSPSPGSQRQRVFALYGMGGAGKTQIALKFIERCKSRFSSVYVIDASTTETLTTAFENIGSDAQLPEATVSATIRWLSNLEEEWLLFFDNADDPSLDLRPSIPGCSHGNLIITSRNPEMRRYAPDGHSHVGGLEEAEAISLLLRCSMLKGHEEEDCLSELVKELGFLALAIAQAGAFISSSPGMSFGGYLQLYKDDKDKLLRQNSGQKVDGYRWTVYTTWEMSFRKLDRFAAQVLQLSSFWHYDRIPKAIFRRAVTATPPSGWDDLSDFVAPFKDASGQWNELAFRNIINQFNSFSLITSYWNDSYSIHRLVQSWARKRDEAKKDYYRVLAARLLAMSADDRLFHRSVAPHIRTWITLQPDLEHCLDLELAWRFGHVCLHRTWFVEAEQLFLFILKREKDVTGDAPAAVMERLAAVYLSRRQLDKAQKLMLSALEKYVKSYGEEHHIVLVLMANLVTIYVNDGQLEKAEDLDRLVLERAKKAIGDHSPDALESIANLGLVYAARGRLVEAEELITLALEGQKKSLGKEHPDTLLSMSLLAKFYCKTRKDQLTKAEELASSALEGMKKVAGEEHPDTLVVIHRLARIYRSQGRLEEAQELLELVTAKRQTILGEDHPDTQSSMKTLRQLSKQSSNGVWSINDLWSGWKAPWLSYHSLQTV